MARGDQAAEDQGRAQAKEAAVTQHGWYAAHCILFLEMMDGQPQDDYVVWENIYLIQASSPDEAWLLAESRGAEDGDPDGERGTVANGRPGRWVFVGVRKVIQCDSFENPPTSRTELSYSEYVLDSRGAVDRLAQADEVNVLYVE